MPLPKAGVVPVMFSVAGRLKVPSSCVAALWKAAAFSVPLLPTVAAAAFSASVVSGVSMVFTVPALAVMMLRSGLPAGSVAVAPVTSSV